MTLIYRLKTCIRAFKDVAYLHSLANEQKEVVFYSENRNYWPHLGRLVQSILKETDLNVCFLTSDPKDPGLSLQHHNLHKFFIGSGHLRNYVFENMECKIMAMTTPDLHQYQLKRSKHEVHYIYLPHSLASLHMIYRNGAFDHFDTVCCAGPHHENELRALEERSGIRKKMICKLGYQRLDSLINNARSQESGEQQRNLGKKTVLVAPSWGSSCVIETGLAEKIVSELLDLDYKVTLRPHPETVKHSLHRVKKLQSLHGSNSNFTLELNVESETSLFEADLMISDWSGAALEFGLALKKPIIFCDVPRKVNNQNYLDITIEPVESKIRDQIGLIWNCEDDLGDIIEKCLSRNTKDTHKITNNYVYNIGKSDQAFTNYVQNLWKNSLNKNI